MLLWYIKIYLLLWITIINCILLFFRDLKNVNLNVCLFSGIVNQSVQSLSCVWLFVTSWTAAHQASLFISNSWSLLRLMSIEWVMTSNHLILCCPPLLLPSIFSSVRVFSNEFQWVSVLRIRWPKVLELQLQHQSFNEYWGLISFRMDWFDLLAVQGTLKSLL